MVPIVVAPRGALVALLACFAFAIPTGLSAQTSPPTLEDVEEGEVAPTPVTPMPFEATTLTATLQLPMNSHLGENLTLFAQELASLSEGAITLDVVEGDRAYRDGDVPGAVASGAVEMGVASLARYADAIPAADVFQLPFVIETADEAARAASPGSAVRREIEAAIRREGAKVLWWQPFGSLVVLSNGEPVTSPGDIEGRTVRVLGPTLGRWVELLGGTPQLIAGSQQKAAYASGAVELGITGVLSVEARELWDVMDTLTRLEIAQIEFVVVINAEFWEGLTEQEQLWVNEAATRAEETLRRRFKSVEAAAFDAAEDAGMAVHEPTAAERNAWRRASRPLIEQWLETAGEVGERVLDAAERL